MSQPSEASQPVVWRIPADNRDRLNHLKDEGHGTLAEHFRERITAAADATPPQSADPREFVKTSLRPDAALNAAITRAAAAAGLEPRTWLMLITTDLGDVLLEQLAAARGNQRNRAAR
jgi:hypothetical protein